METAEENIAKEIRILNKSVKKRNSKFMKKPSTSFKDLYEENRLKIKQPYKRENCRNFHDYIEDEEDC
jgi:predicted Zn-ribbon and HTH transcriptional regulator